MTDREIIKSLYCCDNAFCEDCCYKQFTITCTSRIAHDALELVIRQQAEIEHLREWKAKNNNSWSKMQ